MKEKCWRAEDNLIGCYHLSLMAQAPRLAKGGKLRYGLGYETCVFQLGWGRTLPTICEYVI